MYIHSRAIPNFIYASTENGIKPNDLQEDFFPVMPVLYPNAPQFRDLSGDDATALIAYYDSLHTLNSFVNGWWEREGQLPVNIFNQILHHAEKSLAPALVCIRTGSALETLYPPQYESWGTLTSRIERSLSFGKDAREHHIARFEAKNGRPGDFSTSQECHGQKRPNAKRTPRIAERYDL